MVCHNLLMHNKMSLWDFVSGWCMCVCVPVDAHINAYKCSLYVRECVLMWLIAQQQHPVPFKFFISRLQSDEPKKISGVCKQTLYKLPDFSGVYPPKNVKMEGLYAVRCQKWREHRRDRQRRRRGSKRSLMLTPCFLFPCLSAWATEIRDGEMSLSKH